MTAVLPASANRSASENSLLPLLHWWSPLTQQAEPKPQRRKSGRRRADKAAAKARVALENLGKHIVVIRNGDAPEVKEFTSPDKAREFLQAKLSAGVPASALGFYSREPLEITVGI